MLGKICIVTGASEGIGETISRSLASEGSTVILAARQKDKLDKIVNDLKLLGINEKNLLAFKCDITNRDNVHQMIETCIEKFGKIDVLGELEYF